MVKGKQDFESLEKERIDKAISIKVPELTRSKIQNLIKDGNVYINEKMLEDKNYRVQPNDSIKVILPTQRKLSLAPENIPLDIVYEDKDLLVVNKPKGMVVHPAAGNYEHTLVNALLYHCMGSLSGVNDVVRPGIVHRLDKDTSGLLIVAKSDFAHVNLAEQIKEHSFSRQYEAIVYGNLKDDAEIIDAPIGRHKVDRKKMMVRMEKSKEAITHYKVVARYEGFTHVRLTLKTGRTHQIRVHMAYIGHPVAGDVVYGPKKVISQLKGQCLHAKYIGFIHPRTGEYLEFESELPDYFKKFLQSLRNAQ
ncbi:MAG: RluA family pseudouridine synthase [Clostridia bacterium]|nr:RluA family pseudouridine synthase [Clostridia bacterium]